MRVLVTGVSGFIGSYLAEFLAAADFDVVGSHRRETPLLLKLARQKGIRLIQADLTDMARLSGPFDAVVHAAGTSPGAGMPVRQMVHDNVLSMLALTKSAREWNSRAFIFLSSISLHGQITNAIVDEDCPIINPDAYGATKHLSEIVLKEQAHLIPGLALRLPGVLGPCAHRNWLSDVAAKLLGGHAIPAFNLDAPFNNAAHVADISNLVTTILLRGWQGFDAIVLGAKDMISVGDAIKRLANGLGVPANIVPVSSAKSPFILSSERAITRWGYDPMEIGKMIDCYAAEVLAAQ